MDINIKQDTRKLKPCIRFIDTEGKVFIPVDSYIQEPEDVIFHFQKGSMYAPIAQFVGGGIDPGMKFEYFTLTPKKCYNAPQMRQHLYLYLNYFEKFYDEDKEYLGILFRLKSFMDKMDSDAYPRTMFFYDLDNYILKSELERKVSRMVDDNYSIELSYSNQKAPSLIYTEDHAKILLKMSILADLCIPLLMNYAYMHKVQVIDDYLMLFYDMLFLNYLPQADIYSKLIDTAWTNTVSNKKNNIGIWNKQDIRGINVSTHAESAVKNIILNILPRYTFDKNIISFNFATIRSTTNFTITDIRFEYEYMSVSSSKRDEDSVSEFD